MPSAIPPDLAYAFTVFFLTLGPVKTIPGFAVIAAVQAVVSASRALRLIPA